MDLLQISPGNNPDILAMLDQQELITDSFSESSTPETYDPLMEIKDFSPEYLRSQENQRIE